MKTILGRYQAAPASSAAICKTTIKEITLGLNGGTQRMPRAILFQSFQHRLLDPRTGDKKTALPEKNAVSMPYEDFLKPE